MRFKVLEVGQHTLLSLVTKRDVFFSDTIRPNELTDATWGLQAAQDACLTVLGNAEDVFKTVGMNAIYTLIVTDISPLYQGQMITESVNVCSACV